MIKNGLAFKRHYQNPDLGVDTMVLVIVSGEATLRDIPDGTYIDAVTGDVKTVSGGAVHLDSGGRTRVYVHQNPDSALHTPDDFVRQRGIALPGNPGTAI